VFADRIGETPTTWWLCAIGAIYGVGWLAWSLGGSKE
jgi:hypothetical protein